MPQRNPKPAKREPKPAKADTSATSTTPTKSPAPKPRRKKQTRVVEVEVDPGYTRGQRPSDEQIIQRQDAVYRLRLLGKTPEEISSVMGISLRTVREHVRRAKERQIEELRKLEGKAGVLRQFAVLNYVLEETLDAWDKSKRIKKTKVAGVETKDRGVGGLSLTETKKKSTQKEEEELGDVSYLDRALRASKELRELLGLDAPEVKRLLVSEDPATKELTYEDLRTLPTEELLRRYRETAGLSSSMG